MKEKTGFEVISDYKLLCADQYGELYYHAGFLYWKEHESSSCEPIYRICPKKYVKFRLIERLMRLEPRIALPGEAPATYYVSGGGALYWVCVKEKQVQIVAKYRKGMNNPLNIVRIQGIQGFTDGYVYGDYWGNVNKECVDVNRLTADGSKILFQFAPGEIQHIHSIDVDEKTNRVLICTGDTDEESGIWEAFDDFKSVKPLLRGSQKYRSCGAYITQKGILYATDTPLCDNGLYLFDETEQRLSLIYEMPGPCIYTTKIKKADGTDVYIFATSVEPDSSLPTRWYRLTYRLGSGVKTRYTHIIAGNLEDGFQDVAQFKKDILPMWLFQFGNVQFPSVEKGRRIVCTGQSLETYDGKTLELQIDRMTVREL